MRNLSFAGWWRVTVRILNYRYSYGTVGEWEHEVVKTGPQALSQVTLRMGLGVEITNVGGRFMAYLH